jgi:hypothetical protein
MAVSGAGVPDLVILSGIEAGESGTGRLVEHLEACVKTRPLRAVVVGKPELVFTAYGRLRRGQLLTAARGIARFSGARARFEDGWKLAREHPSVPLLLLHPQALGFDPMLDLVEARTRPATLFLLDSSFFCVASYNHVQGENGACVRCAGGNFAAAQAFGCRAAPWPVPFGASTLERLRPIVRAGKLRLLAQTPAQAELAQRHFGLDRLPEVVGLWTSEFDALLDVRALPQSDRRGDGGSGYDVVFHGDNLAAKGAHWLMSAALASPGLRFLFPFRKPVQVGAPPNCAFVPMRWSSGLEKAVRTSFITAVPSLWSAAVEGALIKSLVLAPRVAVAENASAFAATLPSGAALMLPSDPARAGSALARAHAEGWKPDPAVRERWLAWFRAQRDAFFERVLAASMQT